MNRKKPILFSGILVLTLIVITLLNQSHNAPQVLHIGTREATQSTVCPPFNLYDADGELIDPVNGINADQPYSPRQTCGKCHDYDKITKGFHFQQGADEVASGTYAERHQWVTTPGNFGGNWCSPAPLYRYLSPKENSSASMMDMTSFTFFSGSCGECHPGGGPGEFDRAGNRYDHYMLEKGYEPGGINDYDGDYYQAYWTESGVLEGDCMICHQPGYDNELRKKQLKAMNFRWAATAASGLATVSGTVDKKEEVSVTYDLSKFDANGKLSPHIVREPRNEACINCHAQPGWKKRGANYDARTDVHLRAGLKCVDCHPSGSRAMDPRINEREMHQFAKGDDPGGKVRDDLDNTITSCNHCHTTGYMGAPVARHTWLPALHLDRIACQTCHIPERLVKAAQVQASDVYNPGTKINPKGKRLWVFYGPDMKYYNHYGNLTMMGFNDKPTDPFRPLYAKYKGQIRPVNGIHSAWPGIEVEGVKGLHQPKQGDIANMWEAQFSNPAVYPELALIKDDNNDEIPEVNRAEEIDALISAVTAMLTQTNYPMEGKRVVWAYNDRVYTSGTEYYTVEKEPWEASPYANVHTYNHNVYPANAALGSQGCTECHSLSSEMFYTQAVKYPFGEDGLPVYEPQYLNMGMNAAQVWMSAVREQYVKAFQVPSVILLLLLIFVSLAISVNTAQKNFTLPQNVMWIVYSILVSALLVVFLKPDIRSYILPDRMWFDKNHFGLALFALIAGFYSWLQMNKEGRASSFLARTQAVMLTAAFLTGILMLIRFEAIYSLVAVAYFLFDVAVTISLATSIIWFISNQVKVLQPDLK